jgi:hypothetical protein
VCQDLDSEASTSSVVGFPNETLEEPEPLDLLDSQDGVMEEVLGEAPAQELPQAATTNQPEETEERRILPLGNVQDLLDSPIAYDAALQLAAEKAMAPSWRNSAYSNR